MFCLTDLEPNNQTFVHVSVLDDGNTLLPSEGGYRAGLWPDRDRPHGATSLILDLVTKPCVRKGILKFAFQSVSLVSLSFRAADLAYSDLISLLYKNQTKVVHKLPKVKRRATAGICLS